MNTDLMPDYSELPPDRCGSAHCRYLAEYECRVGDCEVILLCTRHAQSFFPGVPLSAHRKLEQG